MRRQSDSSTGNLAPRLKRDYERPSSGSWIGRLTELAERLLVTGGSGLLGNNIVRTIGGEFETFATYLNHPSDVVCCSFVPLDITRRESVLSMVQRIVPHLVIHTAGLVNVDYCERHEDETWVVNVEGTENIARAAKLVGARLINISTNAAIDGG
ncbi:MAG: sugar nucleotide-binding protein, partial [Chloroflexi bacterium]|nr:sugar nucleotide-binding protein [Chloroflexota bacterium]